MHTHTKMDGVTVASILFRENPLWTTIRSRLWNFTGVSGECYSIFLPCQKHENNALRCKSASPDGCSDIRRRSCPVNSSTPCSHYLAPNCLEVRTVMGWIRLARIL